MRILLELSGENPSMARAEALAVLEASRRPHRVVAAEERLLAVDTDAEPRWLARRIALANNVDELLAKGDLDEVIDAAKGLDFGDRPFRVRVNSLKSCHNKVEIEKRIGDLIRGRVDLDEPEEEVRLIEGERHYLGLKLAAVDRRAYEARKVGKRSFDQPISLHPRFARVLVNLSHVPDGGTLLDPFCGTGGVLLEAGLVGAKAFGGDVREDMVEGCRTALAQWGVTVNLKVGDVADVAAAVGEVDAIATDPPYGRATSTRRESLASLYARFFDAAKRVLRPGGHLAVIVPDPALAKAPPSLEFVESYTLYVHKSLTRHFVVMRRAR